MKIAALISGGKDSIFTIMHCQSQGHEIVALGNLFPRLDKEGKEEEKKEGKENEKKEIDSWMYQSIGSELIPLLAECIGLPLIRKEILGKSLEVGFNALN